MITLFYEFITDLEQVLSYDVIADVLCATVKEFSIFQLNDAKKYIEYIECNNSSVRVKAMFPGSKKRVQLIIGIAKTNPLYASDLIADTELYKIMKDKTIRRLHFVWIVTSPSAYPHNGMNVDHAVYMANSMKPKNLEDIRVNVLATLSCSMQMNDTVE